MDIGRDAHYLVMLEEHVLYIYSTCSACASVFVIVIEFKLHDPHCLKNGIFLSFLP